MFVRKISVCIPRIVLCLAVSTMACGRDAVVNTSSSILTLSVTDLDFGGSDEEKVQAKPKGKPKGNTAIGNRPHSSKRHHQTKKQQKETKKAAKYDAYFETQDSDADASQQDSDAKSEGTY